MTMIKKDGHWVTVAGGQRMWVGTKAQLNAALAAGELEDGTAVMVTDDYEDGDKKYMQVPDWANAVRSGNITLQGVIGVSDSYTVPHSAPVSQIFINPLWDTCNDSQWYVYINDVLMLQPGTAGNGGLDENPRYPTGPITVTASDVVKIKNDTGDENLCVFQTVVVPLKLVEVAD